MTSTISPEDFAYLSGLVQREAAIVLDPGKEYLAISRLEPVARQAGLADIKALVHVLRTEPTGPMKGRVIDAMTTNETLWFRDSHPFEELRSKIMPDLMAKRAASKTLNIWCAAASTGQEPYSIAMLFNDAEWAMKGWKVRITATDLSPSVLEKARTGRYSQMEVGRGLPTKNLVKYFSRVGNEYELSPEIRKMVEFKVQNLASNWPPMGTFDLIFVRNVLIYFNQQTKEEIVNKAARILNPGGYLFLGSTESLLNINTSLERVSFDKTTCYQPAGSASAKDKVWN